MADEVTGPPTPPPAAPAPAGTPPGTPTPKPRGKQLAILLIGGPLLAFGGCALFLEHDELQLRLRRTRLGSSAGSCSSSGAGMFLVGCMIALAVVVQRIFYSNKS